MGTNKVSIIFVTWNRKGPLEEAIRSVVNDAEGIDHEIILVDNASTDGTVDHIRNIHKGVSIIRLYKNFGPVIARNIGIMNASGEIAIFFDDDVVIKKGTIRDLVKKLESDPRLGAVALKIINERSGKVESDYYPIIDENDDSSDHYVWSYHSEGAVAFRRNAFLEAGLYCDRYFRQGESQELSYRLYRLGFRIMYSPAITVLHKRTPVARNAGLIDHYSIRNLLWNDLLLLNGTERFLTISYHLSSFARSVIAGKIPFRSAIKAVWNGFVSVPWERKQRYDKELIALVHYLRVHKVTSKMQYESMKPVYPGLISRLLRRA